MTKMFLVRLMTRGRVAPKIEKWKRRRSGIIVVSSVINSLPIGGGITYGATKRFVTSYFRGLSREMVDRKKNVEVLCVMPGFVSTNMTAWIQNRSWKGFSRVEDCVAGSLRDLSNECETYGTMTHEIIGTLIVFISQFPNIVKFCYRNGSSKMKKSD